MNDFICGSISGLAQVAIGYPLDTYKTMMQNNSFKLKYILKINPYAGMKYPLCGSILNCSITFGTNSYLYEQYNFDSLLNGLVSGALITPVVFYFDYFKVQKQLNIKNNFHVWKRQGKTMCFLRESIAYSAYFKTYETLYDKYNLNSFLSGGIAGLVNWTVTYPIDTIKTRQTAHNINIYDAYKMGKLWKGYFPCALRAIIVNSYGFYIYQYTHDYLGTVA